MNNSNPYACSVSEIIEDSPSNLGLLLRRCAQLNDVNHALEVALGFEMKGNFSAASLVDKQLVIVTATASIAAHIRAQTDRVANELSDSHDLRVTNIIVKVDPSFRTAAYRP